MRLFFIGWDGGFQELVDVVLALKNHGHEIVYWTRCEKELLLDESKFPGTIFHDHNDAIAGKPAKGVDTSDFPPPSADLIKHFFETESILMTMMNKKYEWMEVNERKHFYYHLLQYWYGVLNKFKPDTIVFGVIPHTIYDFVLFNLALYLGIKVVSFESLWIHDRILVMSNYKIGPARLLEEIERNKSKNFTLAELSEDVREYYRKQTDKVSDTTPGYVKMVFSTYSGWNKVALKWRAFWWSVKDGIFLEKLLHYFRRSRENMIKEYIDLQVHPDLDKKYVYLALHVQPERTTCPQADIFVDQLLMLEMLSATLPAGWIVYVKEHPTQWVIRGTGYFSYRYKGYYKAMAALKNVKLVPNNFSSYALINKAQAVASAAGTVSWEAILRGKPAFVFGHPWFKHAPGILQVSDTESCRNAFQTIIAGYKADEQKMINYLGCIDRASFAAYTETFGRQISTLTPRENTMNMLEAILTELEDDRSPAGLI